MAPLVPMNCTNDLKIWTNNTMTVLKKKSNATVLHFEVCKILCHYRTLNGITSCKNARCNDNTLFPLLGHTLGGKLKSYLMVGLSKSFKLLATREGPTESGYNYAMEKKSRESWSEWKGRKKESIIQKDGNSGMGKPATVK